MFIRKVDQLFSILTSSFKGEVETLESLIGKIKDSGISPRPEVVQMHI